MINDEELIQKAKEARERSRSKYSGFAVGAALVAGGKVYSGANIESSSYSLTICAERVALFNALMQTDATIEKIAVVAATDNPVSPCGACRQLLLDYAPEATVILTNMKGEKRTEKVKDLLPFGFSDKDFLGNAHGSK